MIIFFLVLITFISLIMNFLKSPITLIIFLIIISLFISISSIILLNSPWVSFMVFLMMVGGLLILFLYMVSLTPNEKLLNKMKFFIIPPLMIFLMMLYKNPLLLNFHYPLINIMILPNNTMLMIFATMYLFSLLFSITILVVKMKGPLRSI